MNECPVCGGPLEPLGRLGTVQHSKCRNCGMQTQRRLTEDELIAIHEQENDEAEGEANRRYDERQEEIYEEQNRMNLGEEPDLYLDQRFEDKFDYEGD